MSEDNPGDGSRMRSNDYADADPLLFYPGRNLPASEADKIANYSFDIEALTPGHVVHALARSFRGIFHGMLATFAEVVGEGSALETARRLGRKYAGANYGGFLASKGLSAGSPQLMAEFQDKAHIIRGYEHTSALFGKFDESHCVVTRERCIYFQPDGAQYTGEFEMGCLEGYHAADPNLERVDNPACLWKGDDHCRHVFHFRSGDGAPQPGQSSASQRRSPSRRSTSTSSIRKPWASTR